MTDVLMDEVVSEFVETNGVCERFAAGLQGKELVDIPDGVSTKQTNGYDVSTSTELCMLR